jgi:hypothetical protein
MRRARESYKTGEEPRHRDTCSRDHARVDGGSAQRVSGRRSGAITIIALPYKSVPSASSWKWRAISRRACSVIYDGVLHG